MTHRPDRIAQALGLGERGLTATEISRRLGVPRPTVRDWLVGKVPVVARHADGGCERCAGPSHPFATLSPTYAYLLGLYLGDGCISSAPRGVFKLRITLDLAYPGIIDECRRGMRAVLPAGQKIGIASRKGCVKVYSYWKGWPCLLPQHGAGKKHERRIVLTGWQQLLVDRDPELLLRGLIHSDGCRFINTGTNWVNPRYAFANKSDDIRRIFCEACQRLGLRYTTAPRTVYVSRKLDVAVLDRFIGPKT